MRVVVAASSLADGPAKAVTSVVAVAELLAVLGSPVELVTVAILVSVPAKAAGIFATIVSVALAPLAISPIVHFGAVHEPVTVVGVIPVRLVGKTSLTTTAEAVLGPALFTLIV